MARPIEGVRPLTGRAARWLVNYLRNAKPDPAKAELARRDRDMVQRHIRPLRPERIEMENVFNVEFACVGSRTGLLVWRLGDANVGSIVITWLARGRAMVAVDGAGRRREVYNVPQGLLVYGVSDPGAEAV